MPDLGGFNPQLESLVMDSLNSCTCSVYGETEIAGGYGSASELRRSERCEDAPFALVFIAGSVSFGRDGADGATIAGVTAKGVEGAAVVVSSAEVIALGSVVGGETAIRTGSTV